MLLKNESNKNVFTLISGTIIGQALPIAIAPILTRIYSPDDFGLFGLYLALVSVLGIISTGRYELAVVMPSKKDDAYQLVILSFKIVLLLSFSLLMLVWLFNDIISSLLGNPNIGAWLYWMPLSVFLIGCYQALYYWFNREKTYRVMAKSRVVQSGFLVGGQTGTGMVSKLSSGGLIFGHLIGSAVATSYLAGKFCKATKGKFKSNVESQKKLAATYINFPKYMLLANSLNTLSRQLPIIFFNLYYNSIVSGYYLIIQRVVGAPVSIAGSAVADVFRQEANIAYINRGECKKEFLDVLRKLLLVSVIPFLIFGYVAPDFFALVFGDNWRLAGEYAQILTPMFFLQFIVSPLSCMYMISGNQREDLFLQLLIIFMVIIIFSFDLFIRDTFIMFTVFYSCIYILVLYRVFRFSKGLNAKVSIKGD